MSVCVCVFVVELNRRTAFIILEARFFIVGSVSATLSLSRLAILVRARNWQFHRDLDEAGAASSGS